ncbi:MAG: Ig-like domain repeat protein [Nocardioidaceae bacterium]|nr:Ig-like domain repeat protein [Nocardioidaceae bacterium]
MRWRRVVAGVAAAAIPLGLVAATAMPAQAYKPSGSPVEVMLESGVSGDLSNAIQHGWWGHEGNAAAPSGTNPTTLSADYLSGQLQSAFTDPDNNLRVVFVPTSADGSTEKPNATTGQTVDQVFGPNARFADQGLFAGLNGTSNANDSVLTVSTGAEWNAWFAAGQPLQGYNSNLQLVDIGPNTVSSTPQGKSILNAWPAGTQLSMVFFESNGQYTNGKPQVLASGGKAKTAWLTFTTVAKPSDSLRTSSGYNVTSFGAIPQNTTTSLTTSVTSPQAAGTSINLTATVAPASGTDVPVGSVEFFDGATSLGTGALSGGVAHLNGQTPAVGNHTFKAVYTPTNTSTLAFNTSTSADVPFVINGTPTTTSVAATPGADVTAPVDLTATVSPVAAGTVQFKDGPTNIGSPVTVDGAGVATLSHTFAAAGSHTVTGVFTPTSPSFGGSQGSVTFTLAAPSGVSIDDQTITATIPTGTLTVTTPYGPGNPLDLGTLALTTALDGYRGSAQFDGIHVVDTRDGAQPWALTALAGNLADGSGHFINGQNVGLTTLVADPGSNPGIGTITATDNPVPAAPVAPAASGNLGLGGIPHTVLSANQGPSNVTYHGTLTIFAPTTTPSGTYTGTVTFTAS